MAYSIAELNHMSQETFVDCLGDIFEHTPAIAAKTWHDRPFADVDDLYKKMAGVVQHLNVAEQLALIRAHPDLGSKAQMAEASVQEQAGVGLDRLTAAEYEQFQQLNRAYQQKFNFPFIVAVKNHTRASILAEFDRRLAQPPEVEQQQALAEILKIARFRLSDRVVL